jgi:hypothetical protein
MTLPYAHCKGILMGTMTMELGGKVSIECAKTGYTTEMDFKLRVNKNRPLKNYEFFLNVMYYKKEKN